MTTTTPPDGDQEFDDMVALFDFLAKRNAETGDHTRVAAGTFAIYPARGGGIVLVLDVQEGPPGLPRTFRKQLGPAAIRAMQAFGEGSGGLGMLKALLPKRNSSGG